MYDNNCKVSIITVSYNSSKTIEQTIKSVLGQTYQNIEYIIIDGLSTDGTQQIIEKYLDSIAYFVSEKDEGLYYAMNKGIKKATGDIIGIINSDDWYALDAIENVVNYFKETNAELSYGKTVIISEDGEETLSGGTQPLTNIWWEIPFMHSSVFVKKSAYEKYGMFDVDYRLASDCELLLRLYSSKVKFGYIDKTIAYFRQGGLSTQKHKESLDEAYAVSQKYSEQAPDREEIIQKIEQKYAWDSFFIEVVENRKGLCNLLSKYFSVDLSEIIVFGTGSWGERSYKALENTDIKIAYFTDNNSQKWNTDFFGIKVIEPDELQFREAYVLIAVMNGSDTIKKQLEKMKNSSLHYVSIKELAQFFHREKRK